MAEEPRPASELTGLDVIAIGRSSVDLYGQQIGSRLEDVTSFAKSVGGCPANIAIGTARLGLRSGLITRVGDEQMGRFLREQMRREGVCLDGIRVDPARLTALAILSVESESSFPLLFYRENCADMALDEGDIDMGFIARARAIVVTGTHFSRPRPAAAQRKAMRLAKAGGGKVVFDIDYRPNLWGLAGLAAGEARYIRSDEVSAHLRTVLPACDLIVGTEEEIHIAAGTEDTLAALRDIRALSPAVIVVKRGPMGCVVFPGDIPASLDDGIVGRGFPIEVYNVLGAGDAFMSGFLRGWLRDEDFATAATFANACGAFAVSRLLCSPEIPTFDELRLFLERGSPHRALRRDAGLNHVHWSTTRRPAPSTLLALAIDSCGIEGAGEHGGDRAAAFQALVVEAVARTAAGRLGVGLVFEAGQGMAAIYRAQRHGLWIARTIDGQDGGAPEAGMSRDIGSHLVEWPVDHTIACRFVRGDDASNALAERELLRLADAARTIGRELLVEIAAPPGGADDAPATLARLYEIGIKPDWWMLAPRAAPAWDAVGRFVAAQDPYCRGILVRLGDAGEPMDAHQDSASGHPLVKGVVAGPAVCREVAADWFAGRLDDEAAIAEMARRFAAVSAAWGAGQTSKVTT